MNSYRPQKMSDASSALVAGIAQSGGCALERRRPLGRPTPLSWWCTLVPQWPTQHARAN